MTKSKIKLIKYRYAIICSLADGTEYIYKDYADKDMLKIGVDRLLKRKWTPPSYRLARLKITTEEESIK